MSDALQQPPSFEQMVVLIEKLFKDYLQDVRPKMVTAEKIEQAWERYKTLNHLYQDEKQPGLPPLPEPILSDEDVKDWESDKRQQGAVWVKISDRLPEKDHNYHVKATSRYQGYNHNDTAWWRNGAWEFQQSNRGYYVVEWLDEGTAAGREEDAVALFEELWDEHSEYIDDDIDSLSRWAGSTVVDKEQFKTLVAKLYELFKQQKEK